MKEDIYTTGPTQAVGRRDFMKATAAVSVAAMAVRNGLAHAAGSDTLKVGWIGCGDRGRTDIVDFLTGTQGTEIVYMADVFQDRIDSSLDMLNNPESFGGAWGRVKDRIKITPETCLIGFDAYEKVMAANVDIVILTAPPHFRPSHLRAAIENGKHVYFEKPAAVDSAGIRSVIESGEMAKKKGLSIVVGTQQRRMPQYIEVMRRVADGEIGEIVAGQAYWHWSDSFWHFEDRNPKWSDMEWQIRCWPYFTWLSGDHIVEQHCHNLDIMNWGMENAGGHPAKCLGRGGRQTRTDSKFGNIFDHFSVDYEYENGVRISSFSSQIRGASGRTEERLVGTKGIAILNRGMGRIEGQNAYVWEGEGHDGGEKQMDDLVRSIRDGEPINEARKIAYATMTAIMGRMSAYTGRALEWKWALDGSKEDMTLDKYELGDLSVAPVAIPGKTKLV